MKAAVLVFPGSNCDTDCFHALKDVMKMSVEYVWHKESSLPDVDLVIIPGGFSYGDYLRTGAIARFSPVIESVKGHIDKGKSVIGICNGFQILLEAGFLPGAMLRNQSLAFLCKHVSLRVENAQTRFTNQMKTGELLSIPIAHGEGNYYCDDQTLQKLEDNGQVLFRYASESGDVNDDSNPNGSRNNIAGIINDKGNVLGMMPHPERASEQILGSLCGKKIWDSVLEEVM